MLFSWRKYLAGPVVKNAVQRDPCNHHEYTVFLQQHPGYSTEHDKWASPLEQRSAAGDVHRGLADFSNVGRERELLLTE